MVRIAHLDARSGVTGEMWLGALVSAGASLEGIQDAVDTLGVGDVRLSWARVRRGGTDAVSVRVRAPEETPPVRTVVQVRNILRYAALDDAVISQALEVFDRLATAWADVDGMALEDVRFPEVGALDTLADVIGTCWALHDLGITRVTCGPVGVGEGRVPTTRGTRDFPDPVAVHLLSGHTINRTETSHPLVTLTGAALVAALTEPVVTAPPMALEATGIGAGPNGTQGSVLRLLVGQPVSEPVDWDEGDPSLGGDSGD